MATNPRDDGSLTRHRIALGVLVTLALFVAGRVYLGLRSQPQLGSSEEVFNTVDALFTAVTARNEQWLGNCERRLRDHRNTGKLGGAAWKRLEGVMAQARAGDWEPAAHTLYDFIQGQRREGFDGQARSPPSPPRPTKAVNSQRVSSTASMNRP